MAKNFIKFPTGFLQGKVWPKGRKYSKIEALVYLLNLSETPSIRTLAELFDWSKSEVQRFLAEAQENEYLGQQMGQSWDRAGVKSPMKINKLGKKENQTWDKVGTLNGTHLIENNITPLSILSNSNELSNIHFPPEGNIQNSFADFQNWILVKAPRVAKMKEPFTAEEYHRLLNDFDETFICDLLEAMHNYQPLLKNYRSANKVFRNWAKRQHHNNENRRPTNHTNPPDDCDLARAVAEGYARANTPQGW